MSNKTTIALAAAIVLGTALAAAAATRHGRVTQSRPQTYDVAPSHGSGDCSPVHPPFCSNICTGSGPCAPPDSW